MFSLMPRREREAHTLRNPLEWFPREFASLFGRAFPTLPVPFETRWEPHWGVETEEMENEYVVRAEVPGFEASELEVLFGNNTLTIRAEHRPPEATASAGTVPAAAVERSYGRLERTMTLPAGINPEGVTALYRNGVLELHLPKAPEAQTRRIDVKT